jgi:hypothetical protein
MRPGWRGRRGRRTRGKALAFKLKEAGRRRGESGERKGDTTHHVIEARRGELCHHRLREGVVRCLEETEDHIVEPVTATPSASCTSYRKIAYQNSQAL